MTIKNIINVSKRIKICKRFYSNSTETVVVPKLDLTRPIIGRTKAEQEYLYTIKPDLPEDPKLLKVSILGAPNVGKSTLVNRLLNRRISAVSSKVHTTRNRLTGVITESDTQIVFLDTPGIVPIEKKKKHHLTRQIIMDPRWSLWETDLICVVQDVSDPYTRFKIDNEVLKCLYLHPEKEAILILNKIDLLKQKKILLDLVSMLSGGFINGTKLDIKYPENSRNFLNLETLYRKTAKKLKVKIHEERSDEENMMHKLIDELKNCEKILLDGQMNIGEGSNDENIVDLIESNSMSIEKFKGENDEIQMYKSIDDITPFEYKEDLMKTTNWHLYYEKLSKLDLFVRDKKAWPYFNQIFMLSAKNNDGIDDLKRYLFSRAKPGNWLFSRSFVTDQMPREIAEMCVREKMLEYLPEEVPYVLNLEVTYWNVDENDTLNVVINVTPRMKKYKRDLSLLLGGGGRMIKLIANEARQELMNAFQCEVSLKLIVVTSQEQYK